MDDKEFARFMKKVVIDGNGCWLWMAAKTGNGYGVMRVGGKNVPAHRLMYEHTRGKIPENLQPDHLCRVRNCVNPDHIEIVTKLENVRRGESGKWQRDKTHCPKGHEYTQANTMIVHNVVRGVRYAVRKCKRCQKEKRDTLKFKVWNKEYQRQWYLSKKGKTQKTIIKKAGADADTHLAGS